MSCLFNALYAKKPYKIIQFVVRYLSSLTQLGIIARRKALISIYKLNHRHLKFHQWFSLTFTFRYRSSVPSVTLISLCKSDVPAHSDLDLINTSWLNHMNLKVTGLDHVQSEKHD